MEEVGFHDVDVLPVLAGEHRIGAVDAPGKQGHALVGDLGTVERADAEAHEVVGLEELRQDHAAVEGSEGGAVANRAVILDEAHEAGVLDAVGLGG